MEDFDYLGAPSLLPAVEDSWTRDALVSLLPEAEALDSQSRQWLAEYAAYRETPEVSVAMKQINQDCEWMHHMAGSSNFLSKEDASIIPNPQLQTKDPPDCTEVGARPAAQETEASHPTEVETRYSRVWQPKGRVEQGNHWNTSRRVHVHALNFSRLNKVFRCVNVLISVKFTYPLYILFLRNHEPPIPSLSRRGNVEEDGPGRSRMAWVYENKIEYKVRVPFFWVPEKNRIWTPTHSARTSQGAFLGPDPARRRGLAVDLELRSERTDGAGLLRPSGRRWERRTLRAGRAPAAAWPDSIVPM